LFNRMMLGLKIKGRYYFLTLTSSNLYPDCWDLQWRKEKSMYKLLADWDALRKHLKRQDEGLSWCYCFTDEGYGVIHMVLRRSKSGSRIDVKKLRRFWEKLHGATQIRIERVGDSEKIAKYISDQRKKKKISGEFAWQETIIRWRWSKGWIPYQYTQTFGRTWVSWMNADEFKREKVIKEDVRIWDEFVRDAYRFSGCGWYHSYLLVNFWRLGKIKINAK